MRQPHERPPRRSREYSRRRKPVLRRLGVERLEPRSLPAADLLAPPLLETHDIPQPCTNETQWAASSELENHINAGPQMGVNVGQVNDPTGVGLRMNDVGYLQIELDGLRAMNAYATSLHIVIGYDSQFLTAEQSVVVRGADGCEPQAHASDGELTVSFELAGITGDAVQLIVPVRAHTSGSSGVWVAAVIDPTNGYAGTSEVVAEYTTGIFVADADHSTNPYSPPEEAAEKPLADILVPPLKSELASSSGLLATRRLAPRSTITGDDDSSPLRITLSTSRETFHSGEEKLVRVVNRSRDLRAALDWQLANDASSLLFHPLESNSTSTADLIADIIAPHRLKLARVK